MIQSRRLFLVSAASLALTGCGNLLGPPDAGQIYMLNPVLPPAPGGGAKVAYALAVMRPDALNGLDSDRIALIQPDATMDFYAAAQYPDSLPALVQAALIAGFEGSGRIDQVAREEDALHADYDLLTEIRNFEAHYPAPDAVPTVTVALTVRLAAAHGRKILGSFTATQSQPAAANSAGAVTQALGQALGQAVQAIVTWTLGAAPPIPPTP